MTRLDSGSASAAGAGWADYINAHLDARGWGVRDLAREAGIDVSLVVRWLTQEVRPSTDSVRAVAHAFERPVKEVLIASSLFTEEELA